jgi:hypothetical protein
MRYERRNVSSGSPFEPRVGISRAVRLGPLVTVAGTAPLGPDGHTVARGDAAAAFGGWARRQEQPAAWSPVRTSLPDSCLIIRFLPGFTADSSGDVAPHQKIKARAKNWVPRRHERRSTGPYVKTEVPRHMRRPA